MLHLIWITATVVVAFGLGWIAAWHVARHSLLADRDLSEVLLRTAARSLVEDHADVLLYRYRAGEELISLVAAQLTVRPARGKTLAHAVMPFVRDELERIHMLDERASW